MGGGGACVGVCGRVCVCHQYCHHRHYKNDYFLNASTIFLARLRILFCSLAVGGAGRDVVVVVVVVVAAVEVVVIVSVASAAVVTSVSSLFSVSCTAASASAFCLASSVALAMRSLLN